MPNLGPTELILILLVVLLLFGAKRLPDTARSLGRSMRILKAETKGLRDDDAPGETTVRAEQLPPPAAQPQYGQPQYGTPAGQPQYGQPQGQPQYGQPQGQPQYGQPPYGEPQQGTAAPGETPGGAAQPPRP